MLDHATTRQTGKSRSHTNQVRVLVAHNEIRPTRLGSKQTTNIEMNAFSKHDVDVWVRGAYMFTTDLSVHDDGDNSNDMLESLRRHAMRCVV